MKVYSFVQDQYKLVPIEIEVTCISGTHEFEIIGQADSAIKEVKHKIFSAFQSKGYEIPSSKKIFVNLRPNHLKKKSFGLDFAIAMGILWELGQVVPPDVQKPLLYGELGLGGEVFVPKDIEGINKLPGGFDCLVTGDFHKALAVNALSVSNISQWKSARFIGCDSGALVQENRNTDRYYVSKDLADLMAAIAIGEHSSLFAGPKGTGKSTVVENTCALLGDIAWEDFLLSKQINNYFGQNIASRPVVSPHHTSTVLSMVGGGALAVPGEFTRAHGGVLLLDEYLEFPSGVQEALREPMETGKINVSRVGGRKEHPAHFMLMATSNLCPCGDFYPGKKNRCICRMSLRRRYMEKLSGPVLDRFTVLNFSDDWGTEEEVFLPDLQKKLRKITNSQTDLTKHSRMSEEELLAQLASNEVTEHLRAIKKVSRRRKKSCLQLAKSFSVLRGGDKISLADVDIAMNHSFRSFESLRWALSREA